MIVPQGQPVSTIAAQLEQLNEAYLSLEQVQVLAGTLGRGQGLLLSAETLQAAFVAMAPDEVRAAPDLNSGVQPVV